MSDLELQKTSVTLCMLVGSGIITPGAEIVCANPNVRGVINRDGSITINFGGNEKTFEFLSGAARYIEKRSLNGWLYWFVVIDGEKHELSDFREKYLIQRKIL